MEGTGDRHPGERDHPGPAPVVDPDDAAAAEDVALRILNAASQSAAGLQRRLVRRGFSDEAAASATAAMASRGYVDDAAFAGSIAARRRRTGHGRLAVIAEMRQRAIADAVIADVAAQSEPDDERAAALDLALRLAHGRRDPGTREGQQRLGAALQRRGFESSTVSWVLRRLANTEDPDDG